MLTVHHLGISQSERIVWLCEELKIPYTLIRYERDPLAAPPAYKALHPLGTAPIISDGDFKLAESGAIIEYIIAKYGQGRLSVKADAPNFADYLFWFHFANGSMMSAMMMEMIAKRVAAKPEDALIASGRTKKAFEMVENRLGIAPYFAGETLTAADIMLVFGLSTSRALSPRDISGFPNILAYLKRIGARPAYQRAMAKAEPGMTPLLS